MEDFETVLNEIWKIHKEMKHMQVSQYTIDFYEFMVFCIRDYGESLLSVEEGECPP